jgi:hypothetical protein
MDTCCDHERGSTSPAVSAISEAIFVTDGALAG